MASAIQETDVPSLICNHFHSHKHHLVWYFVAPIGHQMICHAPYCPRGGPVENVLNHIQHNLALQLHTIGDEVNPQQTIHATVLGIAKLLYSITKIYKDYKSLQFIASILGKLFQMSL
jgi:hypothetical protein